MVLQVTNNLNYNELTQEIKEKTLIELENDCNNCIKCDLGKTRTNIVFSNKADSAKVMLIGEAPGKNEDEQGLPFVGRAGKLLTELLSSQGIDRNKDIYICNTVKCRPPNNRVPTPKEKEACKIYLESQIKLINPKIILLAGATAVKSILETKQPISKIRGQWFDGPLNSKIMPIFHPSYLLRYSTIKPGSPKQLMIEDLSKVKKILEQDQN